MDKIKIITSLINAKLFNKRIPLFISWAITNRCVYHCQYCRIWEKDNKELTTNQIFLLIDEMKKLGTQIIQFTGGEPLLRDDIGEIINYCDNKGISVILNSSGSFLNEKISQLKNLLQLSLPLDGPKETYDRIRGEGAYQTTIDALEIAIKNRLKVKLTTVITNLNIDFKIINFLISVAKGYKIRIMFQPTTINILGTNQPNHLVPSKEEYKKVINYLIKLKKNNCREIGNSLSGLKYLYNWPDINKILCTGGIIAARLEPEGIIKICSRVTSKEEPNCLKIGFKEAFEKLTPIICNGCWIASHLELNLLFSLKLDTIFNNI